MSLMRQQQSFTQRQQSDIRVRCGALPPERREDDQSCAFTGRRNGALSRLNAFIAAIVIVRSASSFGANAAAGAAAA